MKSDDSHIRNTLLSSKSVQTIAFKEDILNQVNTMNPYASQNIEPVVCVVANKYSWKCALGFTAHEARGECWHK